jgi:hypothetical protein
MILKIRKVFTDHPYIVMTILILVGILLYTLSSPIKNDSPLATPTDPIKIPLTTSLTTAPRTSELDNNVEIIQTYTAKVNGETVKIPIVPSPSPQGVKGIITQEIDMTSIVQKATEAEVLKHKVNYEVSIGVGTHKGDYYIPLEIQRNYKNDQAVSVEIHIDPTDSKVITGGELKWKRLF